MDFAECNFQDEKDPHQKLILKQACFVAKHQAKRLVSEYTKDEVRTRGKIRGISDLLTMTQQRMLLEEAIAKEMFILDVSHLTMEKKVKLQKLASRLKIDQVKQFDSVHLAWLIALTMVKDKVKYKFNSHREIIMIK